MANQYAVPSADVVDGNWLDEGDATSLFAHIVPGTPGAMGSGDDSTYIKSPSAPSNEACAVALSTVEDPISSAGHVMRWRAMKDSAGGATIALIVGLYETYVSEGDKGTEIKSKTNADLSDTVATDTQALSGGEADSITDYSALFARFQANQS